MAEPTTKATATLGERPLLLLGDGVEWTLREGVMPNIQSFFMAPDDASVVAGKAEPVELVITPLEGNPVTVTNLWVLNVSPGPNPFISELTVADRRWFWSYGIVVAYYNMRRAIGVKRLLTNDGELQVAFDRAPDIAYWRWSLVNDTTKFEAVTMLSDVMKKVAQIEKDYWGKSFEVTVDDRIGAQIANLPLEDVAIPGLPGDQAVNLAKAFLPEAGVTVNYDGKVVFYSRASRDEEKVVAALIPEIWGEGHTDLVKNAIIRPKEVHVLFTRKVEVRLDFVESAQARGQTVVYEPLGNLRRMQNVLPLPDYQTDGATGRPNPIGGQILPQGTWVEVDDYLRALPALPIKDVIWNLDHDLLQRAFIPQMDLWAALGLVGEQPDTFGDLAPWLARIAALERNYRTTFQINRLWMDRFLSWETKRLATVDVQSGQLGPSLAYGDYCIIASQRAIWRNHAQGHPLDYAINKSAYPSGDQEFLDATAIPGPGIVEMVDQDQGILRVDYAMDLNRTYEKVLPSQMELDSMPTADILQRTRPIAFNAIISGYKPPRLSASFKLAVIVTAVPASPNGAQQLHRIVVKPEDVAGLLPESAKAGLGEASGPIMEIRIGPGREVARIRWKDDASATIEKIFGLTAVGNSPDEQAAFSKSVSDLCLNEGPTDGKAGASLNQIARAEAAAVYASLSDRYEGSMTGYMNGGVHLAGWMSELTHQYKPNGVTTTRLTLPREVPRFNMLSFLSSSERAVLLRLAKP